MTKKLFCVFMSIIILVSTIISVSVSAEKSISYGEENSTDYEDDFLITEENESDAYNKDIFEYLGFEIRNGTASVSYCDPSIKGNIIIPDKFEKYPVTSIGVGAFYDCKELTGVIIPEGVTVIGSGAFMDCINLKDIIIPYGVTILDNRCFSNCKSIKNIQIPESVTTIKSMAFDWCTSLESIIIPDSVTFLDHEVFNACENLKSVIIGDGVTFVGCWTFAGCSNLTDITIGRNVNAIYEGAFTCCTGLTTVTIPESVTSIETAAFSYCSGLKSIVIENPACKIAYSDSIYSGTAIFGYVGSTAQAYAEKYGRTFAPICNNHKYDTIIVPSSCAERGYTADICLECGFILEKYDIVQFNNHIDADEDGCCDNCNYIFQYVYSGDWVSYDGENFVSLKFVPDEDGIYRFCSVDEWGGSSGYIYDSQMNILTYNNTNYGPFNIDYYFLADETYYLVSYADINSHIDSYTIKLEKSTEYIINSGDIVNVSVQMAERAFLKFVPNKSGYYRFSADNTKDKYTGGICVALYDSYLNCLDSSHDWVKPYVQHYFVAGETYYFGCGLAEAKIGGNFNVELIKMNNEETTDEIESTTEEPEINVNVTEKNGTYGALSYHRRSDGTVVITDLISSVTTLYIPEYIDGYPVTEIGERAFYSCYSLTSVTIPNTVKKIGHEAFYFCRYLKSVNIPESVENIEDRAFCVCNSLENISIPDSVKRIGYHVFSETLIEKNWENGLGYINNHLIEVERGLSGDVKIKNGTLSVAAGAFEYCNYITGVSIPDSVRTLGWRAFYDCYSLRSIEIPDSVYYVGGRIFYDCDNLQSVKIPDSVLSIGHEAFYDCDKLTSVVIPDSVEHLGDYVFYHCDRLENVTIGNSVVRIGTDAFNSCRNLTDIMLPASVRCIASGAFRDCSDLSSVAISESVTEIYDYAFEDCVGLTDVDIPDSVGRISNSAFEGCNGLTSVEIPDSVVYIGNKAFYRTGLEKIVFSGKNTRVYDKDAIDESAVIYGYNNSAVQGYAIMYDREFVAIECVHDYIAVDIAPTCTERGFTSYVCSCGDYYTDNHTPSLGHSYTDGECERCGDIGDMIENSVIIGTASGRPGETVQVNFSLATETSVKSMAVHDIVYDSEKVTLVNGEWLVENAIIADWNQNDEVGVLTFTENVSISGDLFCLTFLINEGIEDATVEINSSFRITTISENDIEQPNDIEIVPGMINIFNVIRGDVNGDDVVDSNDAIHLLYHTLIPGRYEINQDGDFNGSGNVNSNDAIYLLYYVLLPERYPLI